MKDYTVKVKVKRIVHPKSKICWTFTYPQDIQNMRVTSSQQIWRNFAFHHLLTSGSSAVNGCRQIESPVDKNRTIIHK